MHGNTTYFTVIENYDHGVGRGGGGGERDYVLIGRCCI